MRYLETIKIVDGKPLNICAHLQRIEQTIDHAIPLEISTALTGVVKCRVVYDTDKIVEISYSKYTLPVIKSLQIVECSSIDYHLKYENREAIKALTAQRGTSDDIMITQHGYITDTSFCNIVFENRDGLFTPRKALLRGTKRQLLLDNGIVTERDITVDQLNNYHTVHLINAMIELEDGVKIEYADIFR